MSNPTIHRIRGMHCASCASIIEKALRKAEGVHSVEVNYATETAKIDFDKNTSLEHLSKKIEPLGYSIVTSPTAESMGMSESEHATHLGLNQSKEEKLQELSLMKTKILSVIPLATLSIFVMSWDILSNLQIVAEKPLSSTTAFGYLLPIMATYTLFIVGQPYLKGVYRFLRYGQANMDTFIGIGTLVAYLYSLAITVFGESLKTFISIEN